MGETMNKPINQTLMVITLAVVAATAGESRADAAEAKPTQRLSAAAEPDPAMRYRFWPAPHERKQSNAAPFFLRAVLILTENQQGQNVFNPTQYDQWLDGPWAAEDADEIASFLDNYQIVFNELERARTRMEVDYPIDLNELPLIESIELRLPEVQESRTLVRLLYLRSRLEMHSGRWDDYAETVQTMFRLADIVARAGDTLVHQLVSIAIAEQAFRSVEEASGVAGAPNFYWALATLPETLGDLRRSLEYESGLAIKAAGDAMDLPDEPIGADASRAHLHELLDVVRHLFAYDRGLREENMGLKLGMLAILGGEEAARETLRTTERWQDRVDELSSAEAILRATAVRLRRQTDDIFKWHHLPKAMREPYLRHATGIIADDDEPLAEQWELANVLLSKLMPALHAAEGASRRLRQTQARLVTLQAIRMAAHHDGRLPEKIDELLPPAWPDPSSGKPFQYSRTGLITAVLSGEPRYIADENTFLLELVK